MKQKTNTTVVIYAVLCYAVIILLVFGCIIFDDRPDRSLGYDSIDITTQYGDDLHFEFDTSANLHHEFISYDITLLDTEETESNYVHIVIDDQDQSVYDDPLSIFREIDSKDSVNLYKLEGAYIFVYDDGIYFYAQGYGPFENCYDIDAIDRFMEIMKNEIE